jgi:NhaA family Na+:H+ antiporter
MYKPFLFFFRDAIDKGLLLVLGTVIAIILSNSNLANIYHAIVHSDLEISYISQNITIPTHFIVNDILMSIFFLMVGIEIKKEMVSGHLTLKSQRVLPIFCGISGVIMPLIIYLAFNHKIPENVAGCAIPTATDIAFTIAIMSMFSNKIPQSIRVFITALAIIDDLIAVMAIAIFYTDTINLLCIGGILICIIVLWILNRQSVQNLKVYISIGVIMLALFYFSGIHTTVSGVILGFTIPMQSAEKLAKFMHKFVTYCIMPIFAFFNSGISLEGFELNNFVNPVISGVFLGLFIGKQIGIFGSFFVLVKSKIASMPNKATFTDAYIASILCGIGFTMSLFVASLAFPQHSPELVEAKAGILLGSILSCVYGALLLRGRNTVQ